ncbi:hypothetical protein NDU88_007434 [Pleurodeles waltl]|uniref:Uncharacterized protein n=1 Tax=Pleurodeles waltl TaxID=8319 RepID=A0AAV7QN04_PLEWA|nr:hypothetical protein NDU88_007434 [Pleurodeles waltl]
MRQKGTVQRRSLRRCGRETEEALQAMLAGTSRGPSALVRRGWCRKPSVEPAGRRHREAHVDGLGYPTAVNHILRSGCKVERRTGAQATHCHTAQFHDSKTV